MTGDAARSVVGREIDGPAIEGELAGGDPVADAADQRAEERGMVRVGGHRVEAEGNIGQLSGAIRREQTHDGAAVVGDVGLKTGGVAERVEVGLAAVGELAE